MKSRIWFVSKYGSTPEQEGASRQFSLASNFSKQQYETTLIISRSNGLKLNPKISKFYRSTVYQDLNVVTLNGPLINLGFSLRRIFSWVIFEINLLRYAATIRNGNKPDIVIVSSLSLLTLFTGVLLKNKFKAKLVVEIRDIWPLTLVYSGKFSASSPFVKFLAYIEKYGYKNADGIVGTMPRLDLHLKKILTQPFHFRCIPMGFSEYQTLHLEKPANAASKLELPKNKFVVAYAGAIGRLNKVDELLMTARQLRDNDEVFFAIFGDGPEKKKLEIEANSLNNITFYGAFPKSEIISILSKCDLLVMPIYKSGIYDYGISPNKWIDYMLSGRPMLISYSGYRSIINEAGCGLFIDANNPELMAQEIIHMMTMGTEELDIMGKKGYEYVTKHHSYSQLAKEYLEFISTL